MKTAIRFPSKQQMQALKERYRKRVVIGWMDKVDWDHEAGCVSVRVYADRKSLEADHKCLDECGIVQVEMRLKRVVRHSDHFGKRPKAKKQATRAKSAL